MHFKKIINNIIKKEINNKIVIITGISLLFVHPLTATTHAPVFTNEPIEIYKKDIVEDLKFSTQNNLLPKNIHIVVKPLIMHMHERDQDYLSNGLADGSCQIDISLTPEGFVSYLGSLENKSNYFDTVRPQNKVESEVMRKFMVLHEGSHCLFSTFSYPILINDNEVLEKNMNFLFKLGAASYSSENKLIKNNSLYQLLNENFADSFAAINLIKQYGKNSDVINMLHRIATQRYEQALVIETKMSLLAHDTHFALNEILQLETIDKIMNMEDYNLLKILALEIANRSVANVLINNTVSQAINKNSIISGIRNNLIDMNLQKQSESTKRLFTITNYQFFSNEDNSFIFKIAKDIIHNDILYNEYKALKKIEDQTIFINKYITENNKNINNFINNTMNEYEEYIMKNYKTDNISIMNKDRSEIVMQEKYDVIKDNLIKQLILLDMDKENTKNIY